MWPRAQEPSPAGLQGRVIDEATGVGIGRARVRVNTTTPDEPVFETTTDDDGSFLLERVPAGRLIVETSKASWESRPLRFTFTKGEVVRGATIRLRHESYGSITGRVVDSMGAGIPYVKVFLFSYGYDRLRAVYSDNTDLVPLPVRLPDQTQATDDRGVFRISNIRPGSYLVLLEGCQAGPSLLPCASENYGRTFYPGVSSEALARLIDVENDSETLLGTTVLPRQVMNRVRLHIKDKTGQRLPPNSVTARIIPSSRMVFGGGRVGGLDFGGRSPDNVLLEIPIDFIGRYLVRVNVQANGNTPVRLAFGYGMIDFNGGDLDTDITVSDELAASRKIVCRVFLNGSNKPRESLKLHPLLVDPLTLSFVELRPIEDLMFQSFDLPDGTYDLAGFWPGTDGDDTQYGSYYVASSNQGSRDVLREGLVVSGNETRFDVVLAGDGGIIRGTVKNKLGAKVQNAIIGILPDGPTLDRRDRGYTYRTERTDQNGVFELRGIVPGKYQIYAWDEKKVYVPRLLLPEVDRTRRYSPVFQSLIENGAFRDRDFMKQFLPWAKPVEISGGATIESAIDVIE